MAALLKTKKKRKVSGNEQEVQNAAKTLYANIRFQSVDNPIKSILITSTVPNEGKTATGALLAQATASAGLRTLLVECDMRRRSMASELNARATAGLYAVLSGEVPLMHAVVNTAVPNVQFLDAEPGIPNPADLLSSKRMAELIAHMEKVYDFVIFDTPPVGTFVDAAVLSTQVDGVIIAVRPNMAKRSELAGAYEQLQAAGANILGLVGTFAEGTGSEYYYAYYTKDGKRVRRHERKNNTALDFSAQGFPQNAAGPVGRRPQAGGGYQQVSLGQAQADKSGGAASHAKGKGAGKAAQPAGGQTVLPSRGSRK